MIFLLYFTMVFGHYILDTIAAIHLDAPQTMYLHGNPHIFSRIFHIVHIFGNMQIIHIAWN